jgi:predicted nucleic acid-binding protein
LASLLDTNVLVHAAYRGSPLHALASELVTRGLRDRGVYCLSPQNLVEFAAVVTRERFVSPPMQPADVSRISSVLFKSRSLLKIYPKRATVLRALRTGTDLGLKGPRWYDVFLAETMRDARVEVIITEDVMHFAQIPFVSARRIREAAESQ